MPSTFSSLSTIARTYVAVIICAGLATIAHSIQAIVHEPIGWKWTVLAFLTLVSGSATIKLPSLPATFSVSETFVFTSVLLFGPAAGTLTVVLDALVISLWAYHRKRQAAYKSLFNICALALTIWISSQIFFFVLDGPPLSLSSNGIALGGIVFPLSVFTVTYFSLNSWIITFAIALEKHRDPFRLWREHFVWLSLNYFGGASVAALLVTYTKELNFTYLAVIVPLLVILYVMFSTSMGRVEDANRHLAQLNTLYMSTIETLAMAIDAKDQITHGHIRRVQIYALGLASKMGVTDPLLLKAIEAAALLHDMGKLAVPEYILNKPGPLTPAEFEKMKLHASVGADILSAVRFPYPVVPIVRHHHENWNGTGYPDGLVGTQIPIGARILSVVDCFDALTSDRPYRPRLSDRDAVRILLERRGIMYDPLVIDTFVNVHAELASSSSIDNQPDNLRGIAEASASRASAEIPRRLDDISGSTEESVTLLELARNLSTAESVEDIGRIASQHLRRSIPSALTVLYTYHSDTDDLAASCASGQNASSVIGIRIGMGQRLSGWVAANRQTIRNSDPALDLGDAARQCAPRLSSCLATPIVSDSSLVGVLSFYTPEKQAYSDDSERMAESAAHQLGPVLRMALEKIPTVTRELGAIPRLEQLRTVALEQLRKAASDRPVALLLVHFKLTTRCDAQAQDRVALSVFRIARGTLRPADILFRQEDDQLVALLPNTDIGEAESIGTAISDAVRVTQDAFQSRSKVTVTTAVVVAPHHGASIEDLVSLAGEGLSGRLIEDGRTSRSSVH